MGWDVGEELLLCKGKGNHVFILTWVNGRKGKGGGMLRDSSYTAQNIDY